MLTRLLTTLIGVPLFLGLCFGGLLPFTVGVMVLAALAVTEWIAAYRPASEIPALPGAARRPGRLNPLLAWAGTLLPLVAYQAVMRERTGAAWRHNRCSTPAAISATGLILTS